MLFLRFGHFFFSLALDFRMDDLSYLSKCSSRASRHFFSVSYSNFMLLSLLFSASLYVHGLEPFDLPSASSASDFCGFVCVVSDFGRRIVSICCFEISVWTPLPQPLRGHIKLVSENGFRSRRLSLSTVEGVYNTELEKLTSLVCLGYLE